jgi:predicted DsbA family dithiol-disulfide isomerase
MYQNATSYDELELKQFMDKAKALALRQGVSISELASHLGKQELTTQRIIDADFERADEVIDDNLLLQLANALGYNSLDDIT